MRKTLLARNKQADKEELYVENPSGIVSEEDKLKRTLQMINMAREGVDGESPELLQGNFEQLQKMNEHNPAMIFDNAGRLLRWQKRPNRFKPA